jgi:hypothetical protein
VRLLSCNLALVVHRSLLVLSFAEPVTDSRVLADESSPRRGFSSLKLYLDALVAAKVIHERISVTRPAGEKLAASRVSAELYVQ